MTRSKKFLVALALAAAATGVAASPVLADSHTPSVTLGDSHTPSVPLGDGHTPSGPQT